MGTLSFAVGVDQCYGVVPPETRRWSHQTQHERRAAERADHLFSVPAGVLELKKREQLDFWEAAVQTTGHELDLAQERLGRGARCALG